MTNKAAANKIVKVAAANGFRLRRSEVAVSGSIYMKFETSAGTGIAVRFSDHLAETSRDDVTSADLTIGAGGLMQSAAEVAASIKSGCFLASLVANRRLVDLQSLAANGFRFMDDAKVKETILKATRGNDRLRKAWFAKLGIVA